jgi:3-oxoacyl-[acyl-carrier protein] reductase
MSDFGIRVNCLAPGPIDTDLIRGVTAKQIKEIVSRQVIQKQFGADSVSDLTELLFDPRSYSISGQVLHVGGV